MTRTAVPRPDLAPSATAAEDAELRCRAAIARARTLVFDDPAAALAAAVEAAELADGWSGAGPHGRAAAADLRAEAWGARGNALRVLTDLDAAEAALERAEDERTEGSGDPLLAARLLGLVASLETARGLFDEALARLERATSLARGRDEELLASLTVKRGYVLVTVDRAAEALPVLREALRLLDPEHDLRLFLSAAHNMVKALHLVGYSIAARSLIAELRPLHDRLGDRVNRLRLEWLEGQIDQELGALGKAEEKLRRVRDGFLEHEMAYEAALVSLDLASLYAAQHRFPEIRHLAVEMFPIFQSRRIHREALAALILFRESIAGGRADLALVADVRRYLLQARQDPGRRFRRRV